MPETSTLHTWSVYQLQNLFATPSRDIRLPGFWGMNWSMEMLRKKTHLPERTLLTMLIPQNGFALHDEKWSYSPLLAELKREKRGLRKEEVVGA
jgi:hypothetical protein